jgi:CHAT domain-containing protein
MSSISASILNFEGGIYYLKKALELTLKYSPGDSDNIFYFLNNIAKNYEKLYDFHKSLEFYQQAEALLLSTSKLPLIYKSDLYHDIALCYLKLEMDLESQGYIEESVRIRESLGDPLDLARDYNLIGLVYQAKKDFDIALDFFNRSLSLTDSLQCFDQSAFLINNIGNLFLDKCSFDTCRRFYNRSLDLRLDNPATKTDDLIHSYNNVAYVNFQLNDLDTALYYNHKAMDLNELKSEGPDDLELVLLSAYLTSVSDRIEINIKKYKSSKIQFFLEESDSLFQPTIQLIIGQMMKYNSLFSTNAFLNENKRFFDYSILSAYLLDSLSPLACPRSLIVSETFKSLSLVDISSEIRNIQGDSISKSQLQKSNWFYQKQRELLSQRVFLSEVLTIALIDSLIKESIIMDSIRIQHVVFLKQTLINYFSNLPDSIISRISMLDENLLFIEYYSIGDSLFEHSIIKNQVSCKVLPLSEEFRTAVKDFPRSIKSLDQESLCFSGNTLARYLLDPNIEKLSLFDNIVFIPDELLNEIPFEAIPCKYSDSKMVRFLVEEKNISYRFSILTRNYSGKYFTESYSKEFIGIAPSGLNDTSFHNLEGSLNEISAITKLYHSRSLRALSFVGEEANYLNFSNFCLNSKVLHISTHSFVNEQRQGLSFLELFPSGDSANLLLPLLSSIPLRNNLLVLSSCETGKNILGSSTGLVSFLRCISNISINNYICTLWKIFDKPSQAFMIHFYLNILNGKNYCESLSSAKRSFIKSESYNHPMFWSPFVIYENE